MLYLSGIIFILPFFENIILIFDNYAVALNYLNCPVCPAAALAARQSHIDTRTAL